MVKTYVIVNMLKAGNMGVRFVIHMSGVIYAEKICLIRIADVLM